MLENECPSALDEAADDYGKNKTSESLGSDDDFDHFSGVGGSPLAGEETWHGICGTSGSRTHKPPTGAEITAIRAAQDLFMSSSFKLQVSLVCFVSHAASLLRTHRLMLFYQMFGRKIHAND